MVEAVLFLGIFCLFFFLPVHFHFFYHKVGDDDLLILEMTFLRGLLKRRKVTSLIKPPPNSPCAGARSKTSGRWFFIKKKQVKMDAPATANQSKFTEPMEFWRQYQKYGLGITLLIYFLPAKYQHWLLVADSLEKRGCFEKFTWMTRLGTDDAAATSIIVGLLWGFKFGLLGILRHKYKFNREPELQIIPDYQQSKWDTRLDCIFRIKLGYIIIVALTTRFRVQMLRHNVTH